MGSGALLRKRDLVMLCIVAIAIYISLNNTGLSYSLEPSWYLHQERRLSSAPGVGEGGSGGYSIYKMLPPIITDLDGDGTKEIVVITRDLQLKILNAEAPNNVHTEVFVPEELFSRRLSSLNVQKVSPPPSLLCPSLFFAWPLAPRPKYSRA